MEVAVIIVGFACGGVGDIGEAEQLENEAEAEDAFERAHGGSISRGKKENAGRGARSASYLPALFQLEHARGT